MTRAQLLTAATLSLLICGVSAVPASASRIVFAKLENIVAQSTSIAEGTIESVTSTDATDITYHFVINLKRRLHGELRVERIRADHVFVRPAIRAVPDERRKRREIMISPLETGSGLEGFARAGEEYVFLLAGAAEDGTYRLLRIERLEKTAEIERLLGVSFCAEVRSVAPLATASGTATVVDIDPKWLVTTKVKLIQGKQDLLKPGEEHAFAIHSPTQLFQVSAPEVEGRTFAFDLTRRSVTLGPLQFGLAAVPVLAESAGVCVSGAEIVDSGIYEAATGPTVKTETIADGQAHRLHDKTLKESTDRVPARRGVGFGFRYVLRGLPDGASQRVRIRVLHPPLTNPETGKTIDESVWNDDAWIGRPNWHAGWIMDESWELVPGRWVIQVRTLDGQTLLERSFNVITPE
jgi:hypothetical protein